MARLVVHRGRLTGESLPLLAAVVSILLLSRSAFSQDPYERTRITATEFQSHVTELDLAVAQREAADAMFAEYTREFDDALKTYKDLLNWVWSHTPDWCGGAATRELSEITSIESRSLDEQWARGSRELEGRYFQRLHAIAIGLDEKVESFRRRHLRDRYLKNYFQWIAAPGASLDLIALVTKANPAITFNPEVQPILRDYELAMDDILRQHDEATITLRTRVRRAGNAFNAARKSGQDLRKLAQEYAELVISPSERLAQIFQLNADTAQRAMAALPPEQQARLRDVLAVDLHAYLRPDHGPSPERAFESALAGSNLSDDQRARLSVLRDSYRHTRDLAFPELYRLHLRTFDPSGERERFMLSITDHQSEAMERWNEVHKAWEDAKADWSAKCAKARKDIDAIIGESSEADQ